MSRESVTASYPSGAIKIRDLTDTPLTFVTAPWLQAYFTPETRHSPEMKAVLRLSDELVAELLETDHVVISTPVYNYNVPAALKAWVDHVVRKGLTLGFHTTAQARRAYSTFSTLRFQPIKLTVKGGDKRFLKGLRWFAPIAS
ncbi:NAD(P)H-dependent oxidoreductase [Pseudomonas marginalis]|uniref:NAD(P)H-dependent oxidoreductase n=1 Tax=Pseudomonas marginalis TaxID=298 RepID=UPI0027D77642|nr:NAD(P)H-dependent oxidoreductase [Pseudomonas marginalis]